MSSYADGDEFSELFSSDEIEFADEEDTGKITIFNIIDDISNHGSFVETFFDNNKRLPKEYNAYMINRAFANFTDTIMFANEMNKHYSLPNEMHWRFLKNGISKRKRYSKWYKNLEDPEPIELLAKYFQCTVNEMRKNINVLSKEKQLEILEEIDPERFKKTTKRRAGKRI